MRRKHRSQGPPKDAYLISFGDTMTALLAFFIVLNSLASEQTGVNLYSGTGSFIRATDSFGFPGIFDRRRSDSTVPLKEPGPVYVVSDEDEAVTRGHGPDDEHQQPLTIDREQEDFERFLNELERLHRLAPGMTTSPEVAFDLMSAVPTSLQAMDRGLKDLLRDLAGFLRRPDSEVEIVVWTPTPYASAWQRATEQASRCEQLAVEYLRLDPVQSRRLISSSRLWKDSKVRRPTYSVLVRKLYVPPSW